MRRIFTNPANWMTAASIACGVGACLAVVDQPSVSRVRLACTLIIVAGLLDAADGTVARWLGLRSRFGEMLDSLADAVSFGMAPAIVVYAGALRSLGAVGASIAVAFVVAALFRLARFHDPPGPWPWPSRSRGLPTTMAGGATASVLLCRTELAVPGPDAVMAGGLIVLIGLMLTEWPFPTFKDIAKNRRSILHFGGLVILDAAAGLAFGGAWFFGVGALAYLLTGLPDALWVRFGRSPS
ncbi:MAG: CDP-alcohol phosphatidyltransferase family protein [Myxococcota bacterium]